MASRVRRLYNMMPDLNTSLPWGRAPQVADLISSGAITS